MVVKGKKLSCFGNGKMKGNRRQKYQQRLEILYRYLIVATKRLSEKQLMIVLAVVVGLASVVVLGPFGVDQLAGDRYGGTALLDLSDYRRYFGLSVCTILGSRQHFGGGYAGAVCDEQEGLPDQGSQLLQFDGGQCDDHWIRWFGWA